jgi:CHAT domain-containing protein/Tfp pilus assembly protein PilF
MNPRFAHKPRKLAARFLFRSSSRILLAASISTLFFSVCVPRTIAAAQRVQTQGKAPQEDGKPIAIEPGKPLEREMQGGEKHTYEIRAETGQFVHVAVDQLGIDVALTLYAPDGKAIASMDSPSGSFGLEQISTIAEAPGIYRLEVACGDKNVPAGRYRVTVDATRAPGDKDRARITAERTFVEGVQLRTQGGADSLQAAIQKYLVALPLWHTAGDVYEEALTQQSIGAAYQDLGEKQKALEYFNQALSLERAVGDHAGEATSLNNIGMVYSALGEQQKALEYFQRALAISRAVRNRAGESENLNNIGSVISDLGENQKALEYFQQALAISRAVGDRDGEAATLNNIGLVYSNLGEKQKALEYYNWALPLRRELGDRAGEAESLNNIGRIFDDLGERQKALEYLNQALAISREVGDRSHEAVTLSNIGSVYSELGEMQKALEYYSLALPLERALDDRTGEAATLSNIGLVYNNLGEEQKALDYYTQALPPQRAVGDKSGEATTLNNIGSVHEDFGEKQKALDYYAQVLPLRRAVGDRDGEAVTLNHIGSVYDDIGQTQKALDYYAQALPLARAVGDRSAEASTLDGMGIVYEHLGEKQKAVEFYNQSLALRRAVQDPLHQALVLSNLMRVWRDEGQPEAAIFFGKQAVNEIQQIRSNIRGLKKETQQSFVKSEGKTYRVLADILISQGRLPEAQQVLELLKNEEYFEFIRRDDRQAGSLTAPVTLTKKEEALHRKYEENATSVTAVGNEWAALRAKPSRTPDEEKHLTNLTGQLKAANQAWSKFLDDLSVEIANAKQPQTTVANLQENASGLQRVVRQLGAGTVALYTLVGEEKYHVILVTANVQVAREYPIKAADLNEKIAAFRDALLEPSSDPVPLARELYQILVGPVAKDLEGAKAATLMWSLDGVLRYVPLAALHDGHEYLVEKYRNIEFTPASVADLAARPTVSAWRGLGVGVSKSYGGMTALPAVPEELRAIIRETGTRESAGVMPGHTMIDDAFTEENLKKSLLQKYPLIHIASHFALGTGDDTDSYLLLGGKDPQGQHLTLAEINDDPDISFHDVELLTLSACNTALSTSGDGREVDGLGMLAQRKGAKAVMATLWSVYDPSTSELMQSFYRNWTTGTAVSKAEALRRAQIALLHGASDQTAADAKLPYAHPYYWAPFVLIGNWQ